MWYQKKLLKRSSLIWAATRMVQECLPAQCKATLLFCAEICIGASKALFGRIAACACLCKFSACLVLCWLFEFFPNFQLWPEHGKGTNIIDSHHAFIYFQYCSEHFSLSMKKYYICLLGVNFL